MPSEEGSWVPSGGREELLGAQWGWGGPLGAQWGQGRAPGCPVGAGEGPWVGRGRGGLHGQLVGGCWLSETLRFSSCVPTVPRDASTSKGMGHVGRGHVQVKGWERGRGGWAWQKRGDWATPSVEVLCATF